MLDAISPSIRSIAAGSGTDPIPGTNAVAGASEPSVDFGSFLTQMAADAASKLRAGETTAIAGINGQASTNQVVEAVMTAEQTLQSAIAIRDKVVSAFLEVSRMSI